MENRLVDHALVGVLVEHDGKFLLVQESKPGRENLYNVPGGHVETHETLQEAAVREVKEESGYDVELTGLLGVYQTIFPSANFSGPVFSARVVGGAAAATIEHPDVIWVSLDELNRLDKDGKLFTVYPPHAAKLYVAGRVLALDAVVSVRKD